MLTGREVGTDEACAAPSEVCSVWHAPGEPQGREGEGGSVSVMPGLKSVQGGRGETRKSQLITMESSIHALRPLCPTQEISL